MFTSTLFAATLFVAQTVPGIQTASTTIVAWLKANALWGILPIFALGCLMFFAIGFSERNKGRGLSFMIGSFGGAFFLYVLLTPVGNLILTSVGQQPVFQ